MPTIRDTVLVRGPILLYNKSLGRLLNKQTPEYIQSEAEGDEQEYSDDATASIQSAISPNANGEARKRKSKARA